MSKSSGSDLEEAMLDCDLLPLSMVDIAPFLCPANEVEASNKRVAYLCRFCAFEKAHRIDPASSGRCVRKFKAALLQRLERETESTQGGGKKSDAREMLSFYQNYYKKYIQTMETAADGSDRSQLIKAYQTAAVLFQVLKAVYQTANMESMESRLNFTFQNFMSKISKDT